MGLFVKGEVVVLPFPFSDLSSNKRRPALVLADLRGDDLIVCQITSQFRPDNYSIPVTDFDFVQGSLNHDSFIRANRIFTADSNIIVSSVGRINRQKLSEVITKIVEILNN